jgi:hypothetical protein
MYPESDIIPLSILQHHAICPRQCALTHVEQVWAKNRFTAEGQLLHVRRGRGVGDVVSLRYVDHHSYSCPHHQEDP